MKVIVASLLIAISLFAQQTQVSGNRFTLLAPAPSGVRIVSANVVGNAGNTTYFYWIITKFPIGNSVPTLAPIVNRAADTLGGGNSVVLNWLPVPGATGYDVLRTKTGNLPATANMAVITGTTSTTFTDTNNTPSSYTVTTANAASVDISLDNLDFAQPRIILGAPFQLPAIGTFTVAQLAATPTTSVQLGSLAFVTNGATNSDCITTGGGTNFNICGFNGTSFVAIGGGGGISGVTVLGNGTTIGTRGSVNFIQGTGILQTFLDTGTQINVTTNVDTTQVVTTKVGTIQLQMGGCTNGGTYSPGNWVVGGVQNGSCINGYPSMNLTGTGAAIAYGWFRWPSDFNSAGAINAYVTFSDFTGSGGNIKLDLSLACINANTPISGAPAFNAATTTGSFSLTAGGAAINTKEVTLAGLNSTGCTVRQLSALQISRDNTVVGNSIDALNILNVSLEYARN